MAPPRWRDRNEWQSHAHALRRAYDALAPGERAELRRCTTLDMMRTEGVAWGLLARTFEGTLDTREMARFLPSLLLYPHAPHGDHPEGFALGLWVRRTFNEAQGPRLLNMLLHAGEIADLLAQLRHVLEAAPRHARVDWSVLGADLVFCGFGGTPRAIVGQSWASTFYTGRVEAEAPEDAPP